jgi:hypothetical protein
MLNAGYPPIASRSRSSITITSTRTCGRDGSNMATRSTRWTSLFAQGDSAQRRGAGGAGQRSPVPRRCEGGYRPTHAHLEP